MGPLPPVRHCDHTDFTFVGSFLGANTASSVELAMKLNIANPGTGQQKVFEVEDDKKLKNLFDKRMSHEVEGDFLGPEWKGYILRITGGNDKQGFPMKQGVLVSGRVKLLLGANTSCYRPRRAGVRHRRSVHGCIVSHNISVLSMCVVKKGDEDIEGLTDQPVPRRLGPKRASNIRKLFGLEKSDPVTQYVVRYCPPGKTKTRAPKIQRLITPLVLQRKRARMAAKKKRYENKLQGEKLYRQLLAQKAKQEKDRRNSSRRRSASGSTSKA